MQSTQCLGEIPLLDTKCRSVPGPVVDPVFDCAEVAGRQGRAALGHLDPVAASLGAFELDHQPAIGGIKWFHHVVAALLSARHQVHGGPGVA